MNDSEERAIDALRRELPISDVRSEPEGQSRFPDFGLSLPSKRVALEVSSCQRGSEAYRQVEAFFASKGTSLGDWGIRSLVWLPLDVFGLVGLINKQPRKGRARSRMLEAFWEALCQHVQSMETSAPLGGEVYTTPRRREQVQVKWGQGELSITVMGRLVRLNDAQAEAQGVFVQVDPGYFDGEHSQAVADALSKKHRKYQGGASPHVADVRGRYDEMWILLEDNLATVPASDLDNPEIMRRMQEAIGLQARTDGHNPSSMWDRIGLFSIKQYVGVPQIVWVKVGGALNKLHW